MLKIEEVQIELKIRTNFHKTLIIGNKKDLYSDND
jgi:hypothetical protein